ncbi:FeoB small GTPase domain-containing protein [Methanolacinia paynteri]|uniref:FeoB small GTPase domain-containing protein n=1 Tax=Methanolacinia paynteri TaxID=230356 RepID=UPI00064E60F9|nr:FeoB small GTPase domain-containing protein [Methanolacinia paynteri]
MAEKIRKIKKIMMVGNPNVGKSALFNRLTGGEAIVSNYPGTTVDYTKGEFAEGGVFYEVTDVPGTYSLDPRDGAEEVAVSLLEKAKGEVVMIVLDATRVERGLYLALEVIERGYPAIIALNMIDEAHDKEILVNPSELQRLLGVPVVATSAISGEGLKDLAKMAGKARVSDVSQIKAALEGKNKEPAQSGGCKGCGGCGGC